MIAEVIGVGSALSDPEALREISILLFEELGGCEVRMGSCVSAGTNVQRLRGAISKALGRADIVFLLGGMGATEQDISKAIVCEGLGRNLVLHEPTLVRIKAAYERAGRQMPRPVTKLAMMPEQSVVFPGTTGLTPGCALSAGQQFIIMLPDVEKELTPMLHSSVVPYLAKFSSAAIGARVINVFGKSEAEVKTTVARYLSLRNPTVSVEGKEGEVQVIVTTRAKSKTEATALSEPVIKAILGTLGDAVYGVDQSSLQNVVVGGLRANRMTLAVGEAGTNGMLTALLEKTPSAETVFPFGVTANSQRNKQDTLGISDKLLKKYNPVSEQIAVAMANGALKQGDSSIGLGITGDDPKKPGLFYIAVCDSQSVWVRKLSIPKTAGTEYMRYFACLTALDLARRVIAALPTRLPGANPLTLALNGKISEVEAAQIGSVAGHNDAAGKGGKQPSKRARSAGDVVRNLVLTLAILTFVGSGSYLGWFYYQSYHNKTITREFESMYIEGMDEGAPLAVPDDYPKGYQKKFGNLYAINEDVAGWLKIEDTQLSYPVVQYIDNVYYNRRDFYRKDNKHGVPWLEYRSDMDPQSDNYVIYGHNMTDGQMFGELMNYKPSVGGLNFLQTHPIISMDDVYRDNEYKIVSVFITNAKEQYGEIFYYNYYTDLGDKAVFDEFVGEITARSFYTSDVDMKQGDKFITLSTCSYEYGPVSEDAHVRTVVVGRKVRPGEKADGSSIAYKMNPTPKMPTGFTKDGGTGTQKASGSSLLINASNAELPGGSTAAASATVSAAVSASASANKPASTSTSSSLTAEELEELAYQEWLASSRAESRKASDELLEEERRQSESDERRASRKEEERIAAEEAARASSQEAARIASEDAARKSSEEAAKKSSDEAAQKSSDEATKKSSDEAAQKSSDEAAKKSSDEAARKSSDEAAKKSSDEAAQKSSDEAAKKSSDEAARKSSEEAAKKSSEEAAKSSSQNNTPPPENNGDAGEILEPTHQGSSNSTVLGASTDEKLSVSAGGKKVSAHASSLVPQIVMNELGSSFSDEAIKAQAVAAYTFVKFQNQTGVIPQLGLKTPNSRVTQLCNEVMGEAVYYNNKLAFTPFFATSAGVTIASKDVWGGSYPYLVSVDSWVDEKADRYATTVTYTAAEAARRVENALRVDLYDYSENPAEWFFIDAYADGGDQYVKQMHVGNKSITGRTFRESVMGLRSSAFDINYNENSDSFVFTSYGYGHGVGMSQTGAQLFSREEGWDYVDILEHYYTGTVVK